MQSNIYFYGAIAKWNYVIQGVGGLFERIGLQLVGNINQIPTGESIEQSDEMLNLLESAVGEEFECMGGEVEDS